MHMYLYMHVNIYSFFTYQMLTPINLFEDHPLLLTSIFFN